MKFKTQIATLLSCCAVVFSATVLAKEISLYEQPKADAKVVGKVDLNVGIIPIYTPKGSDWMKVGDPRNGEVGWVKSADIHSGANVTFTQRLMKEEEGKGLQTYQSIEMGKPGEINKPSAVNIQQLNEQAKKMQAEQAAAQKALAEMMEKMNKVYQQEMEAIRKGQFPMLMPMVMPSAEPVSTSVQSKQVDSTKTPPVIAPPNAPEVKKQ